MQVYETYLKFPFNEIDGDTYQVSSVQHTKEMFAHSFPLSDYLIDCNSKGLVISCATFKCYQCSVFDTTEADRISIATEISVVE